MYFFIVFIIINPFFCLCLDRDREDNKLSVEDGGFVPVFYILFKK